MKCYGQKSQNILLILKYIARKIKGEIITIIKAYPRKLIASEIGELNLSQFLASHEIAS